MATTIKKPIYLENEYIPYQKCPVCEGLGIINNPLFGNLTNSVASLTIQCDVCSGKKIIPMMEKGKNE